MTPVRTPISAPRLTGSAQRPRERCIDDGGGCAGAHVHCEAVGGEIGWRIRPAWRIWYLRGYRILRVTRILHAKSHDHRAGEEIEAGGTDVSLIGRNDPRGADTGPAA